MPGVAITGEGAVLPQFLSVKSADIRHVMVDSCNVLSQLSLLVVQQQDAVDADD